uniref:Homeobox domain-containing protein n=1 Tax=Globodera pallida TaxID=36090 RepID=A0A183BYK8_GLOPA
MRPPGGVSFADQSPNHSATSNFARQQHKNNGENGRQFAHHHHQQQQQPKNGVKANGFGNNRQQPPAAVVYGHGANDGHHQHGGVHHLLPNGRGGCDDVHQQRCGCCPYGFHIDLGFVKFAEDVAAGKEQIQNWSSPAKKRARRLLNSPSSSDRTLLDLSQTTERGGISNNNNNKNDDIDANVSPPINETSILSKSVDEEDELPELLLHFQSSHRQTLPSSRARHPQHRYQQQQHQQQQQQLHNLQQHQQQHQSRFYQQQQQPPGGGRSSLPGSSSAPTPPIGRRRFPLCMDAPTSSQLGGSTIGSPLRTSTPRMASEEMQHFFAASQQRPSPALRPSTASIGSRRDFFVPTTAAQQPFHGLHQQSADTGTSRSGTNSAPSSPVPRNFHTAIAQSMAQLRKTSSRGASGALSAIPVPQSSHLSALSAPARHVFSSTSSMATATTALAHQQQRLPSTVRPQRYLEFGGVQRHRMLSPEPHQQLPTLEPRSTVYEWLETLIKDEEFLNLNAELRHLAEQHLQDKATRKKEREESKQNNGIKITYEEFKTNAKTKQLAELYAQRKMSGEMVHNMLTKMGIDVGKRTVSTWLKKFQEERVLSSNANAMQWAEQYLQGKTSWEMTEARCMDGYTHSKKRGFSISCRITQINRHRRKD